MSKTIKHKITITTLVVATKSEEEGSLKGFKPELTVVEQAGRYSKAEAKELLNENEVLVSLSYEKREVEIDPSYLI